MEQYQYGISIVTSLLRDTSSFRYYNAFLQRQCHHIQVVSINWNKLVIIELILYHIYK